MRDYAPVTRQHNKREQTVIRTSYYTMALLLVLVASGSAHAGSDDIVSIGHIKVSKSLFANPGHLDKKREVCEGCHGKNGAGDADFGPDAAFGTPAMRGLSQDYMVVQLEAYRNGTRVHPEMSPMVSLLSAEDGKALSAHFAALPVPEPVAAPVSAKFSTQLISQGETIAVKGVGGDASTACAMCHQPKGVGAGAAFPRLAGQNAVYISRQLDAWRKGERKDPAGLMMATIARKLSPQDIEAVAAYYEAQIPR